MYEKNGVIKRSEIDNIVKLISKEERKKLQMGIKIGRYHVYLHKMLKPKAVEFRVNHYGSLLQWHKRSYYTQVWTKFYYQQKLDKKYFIVWFRKI